MQRTDLDADYIRAVVRNGINSMPWYTRTDLSDRQIAAIAAYLTRNNVKRD
jgi:mono/diheme cytochrome c family protein